MELTEDTLRSFARCEMPIDEWGLVNRAIQGDEAAKNRVAKIIGDVSDETERLRITELHEVLNEFEARCARAIHGSGDTA
jgi:hypothetical protein